MAALANTHATLRDIYLENKSPDLLHAMDLILNRIQAAERELDTAIEAQQFDEKIPVVSLSHNKKLKI